MNRKVFLVGGVLILALALVFSFALASGTKTQTAAKATKATTPATTPAANVFAVCGCGKVFTPDAHTEYMTVNGKKFACCSHECHEAVTAMVAKDPAGTAKMMQEKTAMTLEKLSPKTTSTTTESAPK